MALCQSCSQGFEIIIKDGQEMQTILDYIHSLGKINLLKFSADNIQNIESINNITHLLRSFYTRIIQLKIQNSSELLSQKTEDNEHLIYAISNNLFNTIETLDLSNNSLDHKLQYIFTMLGKFKKLNILILQENKIQDNTARFLLQSNIPPELKYFDLRNNSITEQMQQQIFQKFHQSNVNILLDSKQSYQIQNSPSHLRPFQIKKNQK